jgi:hypothetical protein
VPSPLQKVDALALVPLLRFDTPRFPVTPVESGNPVQFVSVPEVGVPSIGVTNVGELPKLVRLDAVTPEVRVDPESVPAAAVTVISAEPLNDTPLMFLAVCSVVAVPALPVTEV